MAQRIIHICILSQNIFVFPHSFSNEDNTDMYKSKYTPKDGLPLTETIPMLLEWLGVSPVRIEERTEGRVKQTNIHRICSGQTREPGRKVVQDIADVFGVTIDDIYDVQVIAEMTGNIKPKAISVFDKGAVKKMIVDYDMSPAQLEQLARRLAPKLDAKIRVRIAQIYLDGLDE